MTRHKRVRSKPTFCSICYLPINPKDLTFDIENEQGEIIKSFCYECGLIELERTEGKQAVIDMLAAREAYQRTH